LTEEADGSGAGFSQEGRMKTNSLGINQKSMRFTGKGFGSAILRKFRPFDIVRN